MIITLSPAKILDFESGIPISATSEPLFQKEATELNERMKKLTIDEIIKLMKVNPSLGQNTYEYIHGYDMPQTPQRQSIFVYNGIAFQGLDAATLSEDDLAFGQQHLIILSGLYGMLRPLDLVRPYRLEMQTKLKNNKGNNLYDYWREKLSLQMANMLKQGDNIWVNLASNEYSKVIDRKLLPEGYQIITPVFKEASGNVYKQVTVHAKKARGMMTRFIIQNKIENPEYLKAFDTEGYAYSEQLSQGEEWVFIR